MSKLRAAKAELEGQQEARDLDFGTRLLEQCNLDALEGSGPIGPIGPIGTVLGDAGYWSELNATGACADRYDLLLATRNRHKQRQAERERPESEGSPAALPRRRASGWRNAYAASRARKPTPDEQDASCAEG